MGFEFFIAGRHLTRRRKTGFISLISMISVGGVAIGQPGERGRQINTGVVQVARSVACHQAKAHAKGLAARAPGRQPAGGHRARALLQLVLTAVKGIAQRRVKGELVTGDLIEVKQGDE